MKQFSKYQIFIIALLAFIQFTVVLDFMILSPLGALLLGELKISTTQFGLVVSAYAWSAGLSGLLAAGFADKFDRKKFLLFFYAGFVLGTFLCAVAPTYEMLLGARIVTGIFGGVISSIGFAIIADVFPLEVRGRVMGFTMTAFAASQVLGIPIGLYLSNNWGWHAPFFMIVGVSLVVGLLIVFLMKPIDAHLDTKTDRKAMHHLFAAMTNRRYVYAYMATTLLATGGFMLMPFGSAFSVHNLGIPLDQLPLVYMVTGLTSIVGGPLMGRLADSVGKYTVFCIGSFVAVAIVIYYCALGITPLWVVILISSVLFVAISARMISASALTSAVPEMHDRGAFMSINSSLQQMSGGIASAAAGMIVVQTPAGPLQGYPELSYVVSAAILITVILMYRIHRMVGGNTAAAQGPGAERSPAAAAK